MLSDELLKRCEELLCRLNGGHDTGHDISHIRRVRHNAALICREENSGEEGLTDLCAMFHDAADHKFVTDPLPVLNEVRHFLSSEGITEDWIERIISVSQNISFSKGVARVGLTPELKIVMDSDRLDAIGAIGIARAFSYGGFRNRPLYSNEGAGSTIAHFYEKLLLLKDMMNTVTGKKMAQQRHKFMIKFLKEFERETGVEPATLSLGS
jgi:uncharacterized protein